MNNAPADNIANDKKLSPRRTLLLVLGSCIVFILLYCFSCLLDLFHDKQREHHDFSKLQDCIELEPFNDFIARYPNSKHVAEVKTMMITVKEKQATILQAIAEDDTESLRTFLKQYPTSSYRNIALARLDSLDWEIAQKDKTVESYLQYLEEHPNGRFTDMAETRYIAAVRNREAAQAAAQALADSLAQVRADSLGVTDFSKL